MWYCQFSSSSEDEDGREAEYVEDGEYEYSTDSELDEGCTNIRLPVPPPVPKRGASSKQVNNGRHFPQTLHCLHFTYKTQ